MAKAILWVLFWSRFQCGTFSGNHEQKGKTVIQLMRMLQKHQSRKHPCCVASAIENGKYGKTLLQRPY